MWYGTINHTPERFCTTNTGDAAGYIASRIMVVTRCTAAMATSTTPAIQITDL